MQWWFQMLCSVAALFIFWQVYIYFKRKRADKEHKQTIAYFANSRYEHSGTEDILWDIARNCISRLGFEDCVIYLLDEQRNVLIQKAAYGAKSPKHFEIVNPIEIPIGKGIVGTVAATGKAEIINDTTKDKRYIIDDEARLSEITVPILHQGKVLGVIDSESSHKHFYTKKHLDTLQNIAAICSAKISHSMVAEEMRKAEAQLAGLNTKMLETKFLNLRLQMNPHFLFNSLSSIQHLIVSQQTNEAYKYLSVFSNFLRSILQYADKTVITLDEELKMLSMYIKLESLGFDDSFSYEIIVDEKLDVEDVLIPPLIIQPLIENAIWHGLLHKEGAKHFTIEFMNEEDERMICIVDDNGVGRIEANNIGKKNLSKQTHESKATSLIKERLQLLQQKTGKEAYMLIEDKQDGETGTRVKVIIPFYNNDEL
jgi:LytS/YehU family sensor histidine kinase